MDELKIMSDDSNFNEDHIKFLVGKHRALLLNKQYNKHIGSISESNYQSIVVDLTDFTDESKYSNKRKYLKSTTKIPNTLLDELRLIPNSSSYNYTFTKVNKERMKYVGFNKWLQDIIYWSISESYLYLYSEYSTLKNLDINEKTNKYVVYLYGIFEDPYALNSNDGLDMVFPLEDSLVPILISSVVEELTSKLTMPEDTLNNAADDRFKSANVMLKNMNSQG